MNLFEEATEEDFLGWLLKKNKHPKKPTYGKDEFVFDQVIPLQIIKKEIDNCCTTV